MVHFGNLLFVEASPTDCLASWSRSVGSAVGLWHVLCVIRTCVSNVSLINLCFSCVRLQSPTRMKPMTPTVVACVSGTASAPSGWSRASFLTQHSQPRLPSQWATSGLPPQGEFHFPALVCSFYVSPLPHSATSSLINRARLQIASKSVSLASVGAAEHRCMTPTRLQIN